MQTALTTTQQQAFQVTPQNSQGKPAKVEPGTVDYSSSDTAVAEVVEDPNDETKFSIVAKGVGTATIDVTADADLGEGQQTISGQISVEVTEAGATSLGVTAGAITEQS